MLKKNFVILFVFICTINIFAQSHDIHNQITKINVEIEILKKNIEKQNIQKSINNIEKKVQELNLDNKNVNVTIKNDLKTLLSELIKLNKIETIKEEKEKEKEKSWTPSDWGTIAIAFLTLFIVFLTGISVYLLKKQNREQKVTNEETIDLLKIEQDLHHNSIMLNHFTNQINNLISSLEMIEKELNIFVGKFIDLSGIEKNTYKTEIFCFKFQSLIIMINKALPYGYNLELLRINLGSYVPIAKILYNKKKIDEDTYRHFKIMIASSVHIGRDININLNNKFVEELKIELEDFNKEDIFSIEYFHGKTIDDLKIKFEVKLKNGNLYQRDEKGNWIF